MGGKRTRTLDTATVRHIKRVCVSLESWLCESQGWEPLRKYEKPYPVSQMTVIEYLAFELEEAEEILKSGGHTGEDLHWDTWEYEFSKAESLADSLQRNEPEREATLAAAGGENALGASSTGECCGPEWECWSPISEPGDDGETGRVEFQEKLIVAVPAGAL